MWDERYSEPGYAYGKDPNEFLASVASRIPAGPVLSLAEGEGRNAVYLAGRGHSVRAVDSSRVGLEKALHLAAERGVSLETTCADLRDYAIEPGAWSGIVSIFCHLSAPLRQQVHAAAVAGLRPGGALVLEAYRPAQLEHGTGGPRTLDRLYDLQSLREDFRDLELIHAIETEREVLEGRAHAGLGAVVQILGLKRS